MRAISSKLSCVFASVLVAQVGCGSSPSAGTDGGGNQDAAASSDGAEADGHSDDMASGFNGSDACQPPLITVTCRGKCGRLNDVCGLLRDCSYVGGTCVSPATCGGGGVPNVCGCVPEGGNPCAGKSCGTASDSCGGPVVCGPSTCDDAGTGATCGGGSVPNVCGCTPLMPTSACSGKTCGVVDDGCGGTIPCGTCDSSFGLVCCRCVGGSWGCTTDIGGCMACGG